MYLSTDGIKKWPIVDAYLTITRLVLVSFMQVIPDFHCVPARFAIGFSEGVKNDLNLKFDTIGVIGPNETSFDSGDIEAKWTGSSHSNQYAAIKDFYFGHKSESTKTMEGTLKQSLSTNKTIGDILSLQPSLDVINKSDVKETSEFLFGDDAKRMAANIGDTGGYNGQEGLHSKLARIWPVQKIYMIIEYFATFYLGHHFFNVLWCL